MKLSMQVKGIKETVRRIDKIKKAAENARFIALRSVGKMVRETIVNAARGSGAYGFSHNELGWPAMSPFSRLIKKSVGAKREAFSWAKRNDDMIDHYLSDEGARQKKLISDRFMAAYGNMTKKSRDGMFTAANNQALARMRKDANWQFYMTREREAALKKRRRLIQGKKTRKSRYTGLAAMQAAPMLKFIPLVRYYVDPKVGSVKVGFYQRQGDSGTSFNVEQLVRVNARGRTQMLTGAQIRFFHAIGFHVKGKTITLPPRPWIAPVKQKLLPNLKKHYQAKFDEYFKKESAGIR
jgi:hypothetical protein